MDFVSKRKIWYVISVLVILAGLISLFTQGLNLGIDFTGGSVLEVEIKKDVAISEVRASLSDMGHKGVQIQKLKDGNFQIKTSFMDQTQQDKFLAELSKKVGKVELVQGNAVGPSVGQEIFQKGMIALAVAILLMIAYISFRFEWRFALAGNIALFHDILVTLSIFSILQLEINASFIAAILTIFGYSINDTIVVFDRIRENLGKVKRENLADTVNHSINATLRRSIYTSVSTLIPLIAVFLFGGDTTKLFVLAMIIGISSGTYSSIFVASPIWYDFSMRSKKKRF